MRRRSTTGQTTLTSIAPAVLYLLRTGSLPRRGEATPDERDGYLDALIKFLTPALREDWLVVRDELLRLWIAEQPGTRPAAWWSFDAPQEPVLHVKNGPGHDRAAQRIRLGGVGTPEYEALNTVPRFAFGLPVEWVHTSHEEYYNGRSRDIHGNRVGTEYADGHFKGLAPRPDDPPRFESQVAYLDRHGLLTPAERSRLPADAFDPELLLDVDVDAEEDVPGAAGVERAASPDGRATSRAGHRQVPAAARGAAKPTPTEKTT